MTWFKKFNIKFKIALGILGFILAMFLFATIKRKFSARDKLKYELAKNTHEIELTHLGKDEEAKKAKLTLLVDEKQKIIEKLEIIDTKELKLGREMSIEELDSFFDSRGF